MIYVKNHGERNSGNNFLRKLLKKNVTNIKLLGGAIGSNTGWVHGYPDFNYDLVKKYKQGDNRLVYIFMVRSLTDWLNSTFRRPYHMKRKGTFRRFIDTDIVSVEKNGIHNMNMDSRETENIFDVRYGKYQMYKKFMETNDAVLVKLSYLQDNPKEFLKILSEEFGFELTDNIDTIETHTKTGRKIRNEKYKIHSIPEDILERRENKKIEKEINSLSYLISKNG